MKDTVTSVPLIHDKIKEKSAEIGFTMPSDLFVGSLLKTLIASKPTANVLELGTGIGLSLSWMIDGLDTNSTITSIDNDSELIAIAKDFFQEDVRVSIVCEDASIWLNDYKGPSFDVVFADAWPGKYADLEVVLDMIKVGGMYIIDDMTHQPNWPDDHQDNVDRLLKELEGRTDLILTKLDWSTGIIIATKKDVA